MSFFNNLKLLNVLSAVHDMTVLLLKKHLFLTDFIFINFFIGNKRDLPYNLFFRYLKTNFFFLNIVQHGLK